MNALLAATLQVSAILVIALGLTWLLKKSTASLRHAVIVIAMGCAAVVPALSAYMPSWPGRLVPTFAEAPIAPTSGMLSRNMPAEIAVGAAAPATTERTGQESTATAPARGWRDDLPAVIDIIQAVYVTGVALSLATLLFGLLRLQWIAAQASPMSSTRSQRRAAAIAIALRLPRPVRLVRSHHPMLATWGFVRPQVLLPADAEDWPEERLRAVLLHELAHVRRNDWAIQVLAGVLRAVYWFNPLVWMAFARLRQESEQSCDDVVLQQGEDGVEYAGHLLTLARALNGAGIRAPAAPSMALRSTLARRVAVVLDPATPHTPASRASLSLVSMGMLCLTCAIAACDGVRGPAGGNSKQNSALPAEATDSAGSIHAATDNPVPAVVAAEVANIKAAAVTESGSRDTATEKAHAEIRSPKLVTADILELMRSALADRSLALLDEIARPITGLHHVRRYAQAVVSDDGRNPAAQAANYAEIINALTNTANFATNVLSTPRGAQLPRREVEQLAAAMRQQAAELADATMPIPRVSSINVSTPERRAAVSALDVAQTALRDTPFVGQPSNSWLANELLTLERAAQSVLSDDGANQEGFTTKLYILKGALWSATRSANDISRRPRARADIQGKATELLGAVRRITTQLDAAMPRSLPELENDSGT